MAIVVTESRISTRWPTTVVEEISRRVLKHREFVEPTLFIPNEELEAQRSLSTLLKFGRPHDLSAAVFTTNCFGERISFSPKPIITSPTPLWVFDRWLAAAYSVEQTVRQFVLVDTVFPGKCLLVRRCDDGRLESQKKCSVSLRELLSLPEASYSDGEDLLETRLWNGNAEIYDDPHCATFDVLRQILNPLVRYLSATSVFCDLEAVVCTSKLPGECRATAQFSKILKAMLQEAGVNPMPTVRWVLQPLECHLGAANLISLIAMTSGIWSFRTTKGTHVTVVAPQETKYTITRPSLPIFHLQEKALREIVGDRPLFAVVDAAVENNYGDVIRRYLKRHCGSKLTGYLVISGSEKSKTWSHVEDVCQSAIVAGLSRDGVILGIGGGVTLDVAGVAAAVYRRGIRYLRIPTTLVGLVDAGLGVKHAVNFAGRKNLLGTFYPAMGTLSDSTFLATLNHKWIACGVVEMIKLGIAVERRLFLLLEQYGKVLFESRFQTPREVANEVISLAQMATLRELQPNLYEKNHRRLLDFGHSFSPKIESESSFTLSHGEAVAIDILLSTYIACSKHLCSNDLLNRLVALYRIFELPVQYSTSNAKTLLQGLDEIRMHRSGNLNLVVPTALGEATFLQQGEVALTDVEMGLDFLNSIEIDVSHSN